MTFEIALLVIIVGIILLFVEISTPGFFFGVPATVLIILGIFLVFIPDPMVAIIVAVLFIIPITIGSIFLYKKLSPERPPIPLGRWSIVGRTGIVTKEIVPDSMSGKVKIQSEIWSAKSDERISVGARIKVVASEGVHVTVERLGVTERKEK